MRFWRFFSKPATYPGFADPPKPQTGSSSRRRHRGEDFVSKKEPRPSDEIVYRGYCRPTGLTGPAYRSDRFRGYKYPFTCVRSSAAFVIATVNCLYSQAAASCSSPPVHLFRVDLNVVCVRTLVDLIGKGGPNLLVPSGRFESIHLLVLCLV